MFRSLPVVVLVTIVSAAQAQTPRYRPGEVMLRFADGSDGNAAVARVMRAGAQDLGPLAPAMATLGARVGVPLGATQLGSGNWLTVVIDSAMLTDRVEGQLRSRENVENVTRRDEAPQLLVRLTAGTPEADAAAQASRGTEAPLERLVWRLEREVGLPLSAESAGPDAIAVAIDVRALTLAVVARLDALPEIEDAQPNYVLGFR